MVVRRRDGEKPTLSDIGIKNPQNIISAIMAVLAIYPWFYDTTRLSAVAVGIAIASIPLVRLYNDDERLT